MASVKESLKRIADREEESNLPQVTAADNGKVLTVVEGAWNKAAAQGGGGGAEPLVFEMDTETAKSNVTAAQVKAALLAGTPVIECIEGDDRLQYAPMTEYAESISDGSVTAIYVQFGSSSYVAQAADEEFGYAD